MSSIACCKNILLLHLLLPWLLLPHLRSTAADIPTDTLDKARNMTDGKRLVSDGGSFTLGFFSPGVSTMRYLGVWFSVSEDAVCWVANRDRPLTDTTGVLAITDTGSLLLLDGSGRVVWSSNTTTAAAPGSSPVARLLETGNLVVAGRGSGAVVVWQSFDHPSNTLLPTMKIGKNLWTGHEWYLSSWSSAGDPSTGNYRYATDTKSGAPLDVLWYGTEKRYRTGPWNGRWFSGIPEMGTYSDMFTYRMTISPGEVTYSYVAKDAGVPFSRIVLTDVGVVQRLVWDPSTRSWKTFFQGPRDLCDSYGRCGAFGVCDAGAASTSFCSCARGFSPASPSAWQMRDNSGGCRRNASLDCGSGSGTTTDGFVVVRGVKLPDAHNATVDVRITLEQCRARCLANCSCVAYAPADVGGGATGSGCIIWMEDLVDLRYVDGGQDLYVRSAKSELDEDRSRKFPFAKIVTPVLSFMFIIILVLAIWVWRRKHKSSEGIPQNPATTARPVRLRIVKAATANFSQDNMVGQGGFGVVYKGILPDERMIAVKRLNQSALTKKGEQDFIREVEVMAELRHGNLLPLLAYCSAHRERVLIYEYMRKGSLDRYIFGIS
uniref:non-specific serine/threonine protein kinase n=1 Tax=Oryza brachyantha TaxID=4533 RepID=J3M7G4_ORYBR